MEGLIPMVYKAIKRNKVRRQYRCLSSADALSYNIADFYPDQSQLYMVTSKEKMDSLQIESNGHRRHRSVGDFSGGFFSTEDKSMEAARPAKQLVRFRSHRLFSCVTGV